MEGHLAFVALPEIGNGIFRPLIGFGEDHPILILRLDMLPQFF